jgi:hypothetical protein
MFKLLLVVCFAGCSLLVSCCENENPAEHLSSDGAWKYVSFDRNCGATTGSNLQVSVLLASKQLPNEGANAFIADDDHGATRFVAQPEWVSSHKLRITYSRKARVFRKESKVGPIEIEYVEQ